MIAWILLLAVSSVFVLLFPKGLFLQARHIPKSKLCIIENTVTNTLIESDTCIYNYYNILGTHVHNNNIATVKEKHVRVH